MLDEKRNVYAPTLLTETKDTMKVVFEEAFGPLAILEKVDSFEEGVERANKPALVFRLGFTLII